MADPRTARAPKQGRQGNAFAPVADFAKEAALQVDAADRSAANTLTFGAANYLDAAKGAYDNGGFANGGFDGLKRRYDAILAFDKATDRYNAIHRPIAQGVGVVGGTALGLLATGPLEGALAGGTRLVGAAKLTAPEVASILGVGGATGAANQFASDVVRGRGLSSPADYAGSTLGGVAGAGTLFVAGPGRAGAADGLVTSLSQDLLNGRPVDLNQAGQATLAGNALGGAAGLAGRRWADGLSMQAKGKLGEGMGRARSLVNLAPRDGGPKLRNPVDVNGRRTFWVPDGQRGDLRFEDKFGPSAKLSPNQTAAQNLLGRNFHLNSFLPADVGKGFAAPLLTTAPFLVIGGGASGNPPAPAEPQPQR